MLASSYGGNSVRRVATLQPNKRRKRSHAERKVQLEEEIRLLESGVAVLQTRSLPPHLLLQGDPVLRPAVAEHSALVHAMHTQQLRVAKMQSALSQCLTDQRYYPLYSRIRLTKDVSERRAALLALRDDKICTAMAFVLGTARDGGPSNKTFSEHQFENAQGDLCCVRFDTIRFPGRSLQQVFDALAFYKNNLEIVISEELGHVTVRDDYDAVGGEAFHTKILSTNTSGITTEGNVISFRAMLGEGDDGYDGEPCAVMVTNSVDEDARYPYLPRERVRKDICAAVVLTASQEQEGSSTGELEDDTVVTMRRAAFYKVRRPDFPLSLCEFEELRESTTQWSDAMLRTMRGILYPSGA